MYKGQSEAVPTCDFPVDLTLCLVEVGYLFQKQSQWRLYVITLGQLSGTKSTQPVSALTKNEEKQNGTGLRLFYFYVELG